MSHKNHIKIKKISKVVCNFIKEGIKIIRVIYPSNSIIKFIILFIKWTDIVSVNKILNEILEK